MSRVPKNPGRRTALLPTGRPMFAVTEAVIKVSEQYLRAGWWRPTEKILYWAGIKRADVCTATTVIRPVARLTRGSFRTTREANAEVVAFLADRGLALVAQVHTHPGTSVDHSRGDDDDAFMPTENYVSIVVPNYCNGGILPIERCGVHRYESRTFRRITGDELRGGVCVIKLKQDFAS